MDRRSFLRLGAGAAAAQLLPEAAMALAAEEAAEIYPLSIIEIQAIPDEVWRDFARLRDFAAIPYWVTNEEILFMGINRSIPYSLGGQ